MIKSVLRGWLVGLLFLGSAWLPGQELMVEPGVVIKFGPDAGLALTGPLKAPDGVVLTSLEDDSISGQTGMSPGTPGLSDWSGVRLEAAAGQSVVRDRRIVIRHAAIGLDMLVARPLTGWRFEKNDIGLRLDGLSPELVEIEFAQNRVGLQTRNATPLISTSSFIGNTFAGIENLTIQQAVPARLNWWGAASGPRDPFDNPSGTGDPVTRGVDYALWRSNPPLTDCSVALLAGSYTVTQRDIRVRIRCRGAVEARISELPGFPNVAYSLYTAPFQDRDVLLSEGNGRKSLFVQFRGAEGQTRTVTPPQEIRLNIGGPSIGITSPDFGALFVDDTPVQIEAMVNHDQPISLVRFMIGGLVLGVDAVAPYTAEWSPVGFANDSYLIHAVAIDSMGVTGIDTIPIRLARPSDDDEPPVISDLRYLDSALLNGATLTASGTFEVRVQDEGLARVELRLNGQNSLLSAVAGDDVYRATIQLDRFENGPLRFQVSAMDRAGNRSTAFRDVNVELPIPPAPVILSPQGGAVVDRPEVLIRGSALASSRVQIQVIGQEGFYTASGLGVFELRVPLIGEGEKRIVARASNLVGTSPPSNEVRVTVDLPAPVVNIVSPAVEGQIVNGDLELRASVVDYRSGTEVEFFVDGVSLGVDATAPFSKLYVADGKQEGEKQLRVVARNGVAEGSAERVFRLRRDPPTPIPFTPPYVGTGLSATPAASLGTAPVRISGRIREADRPDSVPNAALALVLRQGNFLRRINTLADADGNFSFDLEPQARDAGTYEVVAVHPRAKPFENTGPTGVANFTINRLTPGQARYAVPVPIGLGEDFSVTVQASAGSGANQVRLLAVAEDQANGQLPVGMTFEGGPAQDLQAGTTVTFPVRLVSADGTGLPRRGSLFVRVVSSESGGTARARFRVDFERFAAQPLLVPRPGALFTGVRRGEALVESLRLANRGLSAANGVALSLEPRPGGNAVPAWLQLVTASPIASIPAGGEIAVELRAAPTAAVADGLYEALLKVQTAGGITGSIAVSVSVAEAGEARVRFNTADLFTDTGTPPQQGVEGARFVLQSETNPQLRIEGTTDALGTVLLGPVPPGRYQYRASGPNHAPTSGRVLLRANAVVQERVFLDYQTVSFTWSVTPTTIPDRYRVNLSATFRTEVPAPVVVISPTSINIPEMQVGEEMTGELTVTNHGLLRADNVVLTPPPPDLYYRLELEGGLPNTLEARQVVRIPYRLVKLQALPQEANRQGELRSWLAGERRSATLTSGCQAYQANVRVTYGFRCATGDERTGAASTTYAVAFGSSCGSTGTPISIVPGGGGGWGGAPGIPGGFAGPLIGQCAPDCTEGCVCGTVGGCEGGGGGPGPGLGGPDSPPGVPDTDPPDQQCE